MAVRINQCRFSESVKFFEPGFCERWGIKSYHDINLPCFFAGVYRIEDVKIINAHKGFKVVWNTGSTRRVFNKLKKDIIVMQGVGVPFTSSKYKVKRCTFEIKDFSMFKPSPLGSSIYAYIGHDAENFKVHYGYDFIEEVRKKISYPVIYGFRGKEMDYVKREYYDNCFVNIKPHSIGGFTTSTELAFMGRRTISNSDAPWCDPYRSVDDVVELINREAKKIGTVQESQIGKFFNTGEAWKNPTFWK